MSDAPDPARTDHQHRTFSGCPRPPRPIGTYAHPEAWGMKPSEVGFRMDAPGLMPLIHPGRLARGQTG